MGVFVLIAALIAGIGIFFWSSYRSSYDVTENSSGYVVEAERLNTSVTKEYDLKKGDTVVFHTSEFERGHLYISIAESGKDPIFFTNFSNSCYHAFEIENDGHYQIEISGKRMSGVIEVTVE